MDSNVEARKKRWATYRYHAVRVVLFAAACICVVAGMLMLTMSSEKQSRAETVTNQVVRVESQAKVLLILSYNDSDALTALERSGVLDIMNRSAVAVEVDYMDAINCPKGSAAYKAWSTTLSEKLTSEGPFNAVICADDEALTFVEDNHDGMFKGMPIIFFNVNDLDHAISAANSGYATGFFEQGYPEEVIKLATKLFPKTSKLLAVVDSTPSGIGDRAQFEKAVANVAGPSVEFVDASKITRDALAQRLAGAGEDTVVFFLDAFNDSTGKTYTRDESARFVANSTKRPAFGIASGGVGEGLLGSGFTDPESDAQRAAEACITVLNGTSPGVIDLVTDGSGGFVFDATVMDKFGVAMGSLPGDVVVINQSAFTWESVRSMIPSVGLIVVGVICILIFALLGYRHSIRDTREIIAQRNDLQHRFYHDQLTDKANMQWFNEYTNDAEQSEAVKSIVAIDFVDFGDINDAYGRTVGDEVISELADRLDRLDKLFLVRSMGAEFLIGFDHVVERGGKDLKRIEDLISEPVKVGDGFFEAVTHIGVANIDEGRTVKDLSTGVDLAIREAKKAGSSAALVFYNDRMKRDMEDKIEITAMLKQSIKDESFVVLYQPQVDSKTNEVCGYEALVRMKGDAYYPGQFIPVAELSGLIIDVDRIVTKKVIQQLATWKKRHKRLAPVSINYSAVQFKDEGYIDFVLDLLAKNDVPASLLKIEITESMFMDDKDRAEELFARLADIGIPMALDDFGTGYTSLSRVSEIPAHVVKIDKSLVDAYVVPGKEHILDNLVRLVHGLGKIVIVEGVETHDQLVICRDLGCDIVQGYYFSKPLLPEAAAQFKPPAEAQA